MNRFGMCWLICLSLSLVGGNLLGAETLAGKRPNIVFVLTDDQGYGDLSCHGNPILKTPNIDRLHREGVRFTDFMVSPTCSPTRSALMTGRHEFRNGVSHTINERERLTLSATTLAQVLKSSGYATGIFGKWHLGDEPDHWPSRRGFDEMFIHGAGGIGQSYPGSCGDAPGNTYFSPAILHNGKFEKTNGYCTDVFFSQALKWIEATKGKQPFYAHISTNAPHGPLQVRPEDEARYSDKVKEADVAKFFGMIANIDDNVGTLLAKLSEWGIEPRHAGHLHERQRWHCRSEGPQRRHARTKSDAVSGRYSSQFVLALARYAQAGGLRSARRAHRLLSDARRTRRSEAVWRGAETSRRPQPRLAAEQPASRVVRPHAFHARRSLAGRSRPLEVQVRDVQRPQLAVSNGDRLKRRDQELATLRSESRSQRED